jgi:hypothetical protein
MNRVGSKVKCIPTGARQKGGNLQIVAGNILLKPAGE